MNGGKIPSAPKAPSNINTAHAAAGKNLQPPHIDQGGDYTATPQEQKLLRDYVQSIGGIAEFTNARRNGAFDATSNRLPDCKRAIDRKMKQEGLGPLDYDIVIEPKGDGSFSGHIALLRPITNAQSAGMENNERTARSFAEGIATPLANVRPDRNTRLTELLDGFQSFAKGTKNSRKDTAAAIGMPAGTRLQDWRMLVLPHISDIPSEISRAIKTAGGKEGVDFFTRNVQGEDAGQDLHGLQLFVKDALLARMKQFAPDVAQAKSGRGR